MIQLRNLVVTGATGKQGSALISALLSKPPPLFNIYAVTRNTSSPSAQKLAKQPNVKVIQGDFDDAQAIFRQIDAPWGLFAMTNQMVGEEREEQQGKALINAAVGAGVSHIVFSATDRGGDGKSDHEPTYVPHFRSKYHIEREILTRAEENKGKLTWTFLRPVAFLENIAPGIFGKGFMAMWRLNGNERPLQLISTADIGLIAADAFLNAGSDEYLNKAISLAGVEISPKDATQIFKKVTGEAIPSTWNVAGRLLKSLKADLRLMFNWFLTDDFGADVQAVRKRYPFMRDFQGWLEQESAWQKQQHPMCTCAL